MENKTQKWTTKLSMTRAVVYIAITMLSLIIGSTAVIAGWSSTVSTHTEQIQLANVDRQKIKKTVTELRIQLSAINTILEDTAHSVDRMQASSSEVNTRLTRLQTDVEGFKVTQQQMLEVLVKLNRQLNGHDD